MGINEKYEGDVSVALTQFGRRYGLAVTMGVPDMDARISRDRGVLGDSYRVLAVFHGVNVEAQKKISDAAKQLQNGKNVDLDNLLS